MIYLREGGGSAVMIALPPPGPMAVSKSNIAVLMASKDRIDECAGQ